MTDTTPAPSSQDLQRLDVTHVEGDVYAIDVRGHQLRVDQPLDAGGTDTAPTPTELFVASLATCVAFYAGRYLLRHGLPRTGLSVRTEFAMAADPPARVAAVHVVVTPPPELPEERRAGLLAVASHCTVHTTLRQPPETTVELEPSTPGRRTDESAPSGPSARP
ncbi:OsmC family protein [Streptomyces goshikiensis]|uniref:OsmC family protein n=1 Tax=Streptomyces goshikiensis TaxID=1942 RepID=UPI002E1012EA|nr:OsmC family protein [Streptomyces goshikiensis]WSS02958.1 OsmC family protein [Streptomyces goshikiensis]